MKQIEPLTIWSADGNKVASSLTARIINDDLTSSCTFYWELKEADEVVPSENEESITTTGAVLAKGNVTISGEEYKNWEGGNDYAYSHIAEQINVKLV